MELLKQRIQREGVNMGHGILKVDSFINHQVDPALMLPALMTGLALGIPVVYARKTKPVTMHPNAMLASAPSHTKGVMTELMVSPEFLGPRDHVLVVDDFLARGETIRALVDLVKKSGAALVAIGAVIEKRFEGGRAALDDLGVPIETLAVITSMDNGKIEME
jgi:xanthine phosphoribosyltransferase